MRDIFQTTLTQVVDGTLVPLENVEVTVFPVNTTTNPSVIYQKREGQAQGNAIEAAGVGGPNPFTTGPSGAVEFWLPAGVYDIHIRDTVFPERIARRGAGGVNPPLQFNSMPASVGSVPSSIIAADAGLSLDTLAPDVQRQDIPIGTVIEWWRPTAQVPLPAGFDIADGRSVPASAHDFPGVSGNVTLPDLRNTFILGADPFKTDASGATAGDGTAASGAQHPNAPGIRGKGGSMMATLVAANIPSHTHAITDPGHSHSGTAGSHSHSFPNGTVTKTYGTTGLVAGGTAYLLPFGNPEASSTSSASSSVSINSSTTGVSIAPYGPGTPFAHLPVYYGLLRLMKVKKA